MNDNQYSAILGLKIPPIIDKITENSNLSTLEAISCFYQSNLYRKLADESLKLWHYGTLTLYTMFQDELLTGKFDYPEGI